MKFFFQGVLDRRKSKQPIATERRKDAIEQRGQSDITVANRRVDAAFDELNAVLGSILRNRDAKSE